MALPVGVGPGEVGLKQALGQSVLSWLLEVGAGWEVTMTLCTQGNWGPEMDPLLILFFPVIRPADSHLSLYLSDNFLILKGLPDSGTLCRHFKIGLMEAL